MSQFLDWLHTKYSYLLIAASLLVLRVLKNTRERKEMSPDLINWMITVPASSGTKILAGDRVTRATE